MHLKEVQPISDYQLILTFENREKRQFDMNPYLDKGIFQELRDVSVFNTVRLSFDTIEWANEADLDPEILYKNSIEVMLDSLLIAAISFHHSDSNLCNNSIHLPLILIFPATDTFHPSNGPLQ
jgi:hypothetical protein